MTIDQNRLGVHGQPLLDIGWLRVVRDLAGNTWFIVDEIARTEGEFRRMVDDQPLRDAATLLNKAHGTLKGVEVFVKSKERIKAPEGEEFFDDQITDIEAWLNDYAPWCQ